MTEEKKNIYISYWLLLITLLVATMIVVGGLTRLTDSGLSITKWDLFTGIIPPISLEKWNLAFSLYKQIPEYKILNSSMTLGEFKIIYWWEYIHRLLGRLVGLLYLIPLLFFIYTKKIKKTDLIIFNTIFILICFQGFIGWYMVKSGLVERTDVSQYRLSLHLTTAFIIYILLFWTYLKLINTKNYKYFKKLPYKISYVFTFMILLQISLGAFVSGLDAGKIYQSWPLMGDSFFPNDSNLKDLFSLQLFDEPSLVQFLHRNFAYVILLFFIFISYFVYSNNDFHHIRKSVFFIFIALFVQIVLGILTIMSGAQIILASMHQIVSIFLISTSLNLSFKDSKN